MSKPDPSVPRHDCVSDSPYTEYLYDDGEGNTTVSPIPPDLLAQAKVEWEKTRGSLAARERKQKAKEVQDHPPSPETTG